MINVSFNLESRDFDGKWYHNINAWKVEAEEAPAYTAPDNYGKIDEPAPQKQAAPVANSQDDGLPF